MKMPLLCFEDGNLLVFESPEAAEQELEAVDLVNEEYAMFEARGFPVEEDIPEKAKPVGGEGLGFSSVRDVPFKLRVTDTKDSERLTSRLDTILKAHPGLSSRELAGVSFEMKVALARSFWG
jgi:hypothetical protein